MTLETAASPDLSSAVTDISEWTRDTFKHVPRTSLASSIVFSIEMTTSLAPFPAEIYERIFSYACTDDGTTGRSLSLVSKLIHDASLNFKHFSIAVDGPAQAVGFAKLMETLPPNRRNIRHLFVSNGKPTSVSRKDSSHSKPDQEARKKFSLATVTPDFSKLLLVTQHQQSWSKMMAVAREYARQRDISKEERKNGDETVFRCLIRILIILAPTLETLYVFFESREISLPNFESTWKPSFPDLPVLTELSITYRAHIRAVWMGWYVESGPSSLPSLKRLDISGIQSQSYNPFSDYPSISRPAPTLTHLCIPASMVGYMRGALEDARPEFEHDFRGLLPPNLDHVFIQLNQTPEFNCCGGDDRYDTECDNCRSLATKDERFTIFKPSREKKTCEIVKNDWLTRILGLEGRWDAETI